SAGERAADRGAPGPLDPPGPHPGSQRHQLSPAGRQEATQTFLSWQPDHSTPGGASWRLAARPPARFSSQSNLLRLSNLTPPPGMSLLPPGAALLDRHPPHFSTAVHNVVAPDGVPLPGGPGGGRRMGGGGVVALGNLAAPMAALGGGGAPDGGEHRHPD